MLVNFINGDFPVTTKWSLKYKKIFFWFCIIVVILHVAVISGYIFIVASAFSKLMNLPTIIHIFSSSAFFAFMTSIWINISKRLYKEISA